MYSSTLKACCGVPQVMWKEVLIETDLAEYNIFIFCHSIIVARTSTISIDFNAEQ